MWTDMPGNGISVKSNVTKKICYNTNEVKCIIPSRYTYLIFDISATVIKEKIHPEILSY